MRVNARFEGVSEQQVEYLASSTGLKLSDVLRDSVDFYYRHMRAQGAGLKHLSSLLGQGDSGRSDISANVKQFVDAGMAEKYAARPVAPSTSKRVKRTLPKS